MASSGSYDFSVNRNQIIDLAGQIAGIKGIGRVLSAEDTDTASRLLNLIVKQWQGKPDFAPGMKVWTRKRAYLFLQLNDTDYTLGPGGDHATASFVETTLTAAASAGATAMSVASITGISASDNVGVRLTDGSIHWTTVSGAPSGSTVTLASGIPTGKSAASGARLIAYTTKIMLPLQMISVRRRDSNNNETPLERMALSYYEQGLLNKANSGTPTGYLYERGQSTTGTLFVDYKPVAADTLDTYLLTFLRPVEDFDAATDSPDYPQEWHRPLVGQLAMDWATATGRPVTQEMKDYRNDAIAIAGNVDPDNETEDAFFKAET